MAPLSPLWLLVCCVRLLIVSTPFASMIGTHEFSCSGIYCWDHIDIYMKDSVFIVQCLYVFSQTYLIERVYRNCDDHQSSVWARFLDHTVNKMVLS